MSAFDSKIFNAEVFAKYSETIPRTKKNELLNSGALTPKPEWRNMFPDQVGGNFAVIPITGRISGTPDKYDGNTDITAETLDTYSQSIVAVGFAKGFVEKDFTTSITGKDFMAEVASQIAEYWDDVDQDTLLAILEGVFKMTGAEETKFSTSHTHDISAEADEGAKVDATTLNKAIQKAGGDNKSIFTMAIMHSVVATNLENLNLLSYLKYTDANGVQRDLGLATWNGRTVLIDDSLPVNSDVYTTYVLGMGAFDFTSLDVKTPYEMERKADKNGGQDTLYTRQRNVFAPRGISFKKDGMAGLSPDLSEFKLGTAWELAKNSAGTKAYPIKAIPIARIISKG